MEKIKNNKNIENNILNELQKYSLKELIELFGDIPIKVLEKPINHDVKEAISNSLYEDSEVTFDEINNKNI